MDHDGTTGSLSREELKGRLTGDLWLDNATLNEWEYATKATELESLPPPRLFAGRGLLQCAMRVLRLVAL
jgi:hypothetical protein